VPAGDAPAAGRDVLVFAAPRLVAAAVLSSSWPTSFAASASIRNVLVERWDTRRFASAIDSGCFHGCVDDSRAARSISPAVATDTQAPSTSGENSGAPSPWRAMWTVTPLATTGFGTTNSAANERPASIRRMSRVADKTSEKFPAKHSTASLRENA
jgi:hypothetical protein